MNIETPQAWRKGQTLFNFLAWLRRQKGFMASEVGGKLADVYYMSDIALDAYWEEFK